MEDKINLNDFNDIWSVLKKYDGSHITFFGKVSADNQIGEMVSSGILKVNLENGFHAITVGEDEVNTLKIIFSDKTVLKVLQYNELISESELLNLYVEFTLEGLILNRGWQPSDAIFYPSDARKTNKLSISERDYYKKISEVIRNNIGAKIKLWVLAFDEEPQRIKERIEDKILEDLKFKGYYFEGIINPPDGVPTIETEKGTISISYHEFIGAPMIMTFYSGLQIMVSDLYILVNEQVIQPKDLKIENYTWSKE